MLPPLPLNQNPARATAVNAALMVRRMPNRRSLMPTEIVEGLVRSWYDMRTGRVTLIAARDEAWSGTGPIGERNEQGVLTAM
jgi:hypothetical protein